jgi:hypothetical protein
MWYTSTGLPQAPSSSAMCQNRAPARSAISQMPDGGIHTGAVWHVSLALNI